MIATHHGRQPHYEGNDHRVCSVFFSTDEPVEIEYNYMPTTRFQTRYILVSVDIFRAATYVYGLASNGTTFVYEPGAFMIFEGVRSHEEALNKLGVENVLFGTAISI